MTKRFGDLVGDILCGAPAPAAPAIPDADGFDILAALAVRHGVEAGQLVNELSGESGLAKIARSLLCLEGLERSKRKRGGQRKDDLNWAKFGYALRSRIGEPGISTKEIARRWVSENGGENENHSRAESFEKQLNRLNERWGDTPTLQILMLDAPPNVTRT